MTARHSRDIQIRMRPPEIAKKKRSIGRLKTLCQFYLGICRNTFRALCGRDPDIARRYRRGKAKAIAHVANSLLQKARSGDNAAMFFFLKTQGGWRETARIEAIHQDDDMEPPYEEPRGHLIDLTRLSDSALAEVAALYNDSHAPKPHRQRQGLIRRY